MPRNFPRPLSSHPVGSPKMTNDSYNLCLNFKTNTLIQSQPIGCPTLNLEGFRGFAMQCSALLQPTVFFTVADPHWFIEKLLGTVKSPNFVTFF
jgi:hypothetical protein